MEHIGIDLGARDSQIAIVSADGQLQQELTVVTEGLPEWLSQQPRSYVVMETCTQSRAVARAALRAQHETRVVPGQLVRALGVGHRGIKNDRRDALVLALASQRNPNLPSAHLRSERSSDLHELLAGRTALVKARRSIALSCKSWLRARLLTIRGRAKSKHFSDTVRRLAVEHPDGLPVALEAQLVTFEQLTEQIDELTEQIHDLAEQDPVSKRLQTVPGVGPLVALAFIAQLDTPERFTNADELGSYLALVPGESTTGGKIKRTSTLKAGPRHLKALLVQAAWVLWRTRKGEPLVQWARALADKRGKRIAIVALARKLAVIMWAMWRHQRPYDPSRAVRASHRDAA